MESDAAGFDAVVGPQERAHIAAARADPQQFPASESGAPIAGLALSGGGIRSATFNLGLIQAFARAGKLTRFDYLSTVSGGGYIGGWLTAWIHRKGIAEVERELARVAPSAAEEPHEVRWLRAYSNYLTPRKGLASLDTLWGASTYIRNLLINQLLFAAFVLALLFLAAAGHAYLSPLARSAPFGTAIIGMALMLLAAPFVGFEFAHLRGQDPRPGLARFICWLQAGPSPWIIAGLSLTGAILLAYALPHPAAWFLAGDAFPEKFLSTQVLAIVRGGLPFAAFWLIAWLAALLAFRRPANVSMAKLLRPDAGILVAIFAASIAFAWLQAIYAWLAGRIPVTHDWLLALVGPLGYVTAIELAVLLLILLAGTKLRAHAHDWLSRMAAVIIVIGLPILAAFAVWLLLVPTIDYLRGGVTLPAAATAWIASTLAGVLGGKSSATNGQGKSGWRGVLLAATPYIFLVGIFAVLGYAGRAIMFAFAATGTTEATLASTNPWLIAVESNMVFLAEGVLAEAWLFAFLVAFAVLMVLTWRIDINLFSFHSYYRNRLVHAYLGASAEDRRANTFTGYAPGDSPYLHALDRTLAGKPIRPYPIVNTALNLTGSSRSEWQERKAASFVFSPKYCGFELPRTLSPRRDMKLCPQNLHSHFVRAWQPTADFVKRHPDRALSQGIAITISGAAASPNMGYHTSRALAALMTVFNVRLGWWMPNTLHGRLWRAGGPRLSILYLLAEFLGFTTEDSRFVYLSDGGHFENLGVYELLRRRCPLVVASDAGADATFRFEDLGNLIRKARVDLQVEIDIRVEAIIPAEIDAQGVIGESKANFAIGHISYPPAVEGGPPEHGWLVYVKSSIPAGLPADVDNYRRTHPGFPHQSTADQWFDEGQFESYRRLGLAVGGPLLAELGKMERVVGW